MTGHYVRNLLSNGSGKQAHCTVFVPHLYLLLFKTKKKMYLKRLFSYSFYNTLKPNEGQRVIVFLQYNGKVFIITLTWSTSVFLKSTSVDNFMPERYWLCDIRYNTYALMPNNTVTVDSSISGPCWISLTQLGSGTLQDQCVHFWSGILDHFMAPSTGCQLCEPPTEPQRETEGKGRKRAMQRGVWFHFTGFCQIITSCHMAYEWWCRVWKKQVELKGDKEKG